MEELDTAAKAWTPEQKENAAKYSRITSSDKKRPSMSINDVRELVQTPLQTTLAAHIRTQTPLLAKLSFSIFCVTGEAKFITSDAPVVWFDPESYKRPPLYQGPALMYKSLEITMPISPAYLLFLSYSNLPEYVEVSDNAVDELNRRTRAYAFESFVSVSSITKPYWYEIGSPPAQQNYKANLDENDQNDPWQA